MTTAFKKFLLEILLYFLLTLAFLAALYFTFRTGRIAPEMLLLYGCLVIIAYMALSIYVAVSAALLATLVVIAAAIVEISLLHAVTMLALYWGIIYFLNCHTDAAVEEYGRNKLLLENAGGRLTEFEEGIKRGKALISELEKGINRYEGMEKFSMKLGTTFSLKDISMYITNFTRSAFPSAQVRLIKDAQDACDRWVYSQQKPLCVESTATDYRFNSFASRPGASIIACPVFNGEAVQFIIKVTAEEKKLSLPDLRVLTLIGSLSSIAVENMTLFEKTQELSITDDLTGLYTHTHFMERLRGEVERASMYAEKFVFVMLDIDNFKKFNDSFGHPAGDEVLAGVSRRILKSIRKTDIVGRYGGEEISVILPRTDFKSGLDIARNIRKAVKNERFNFGGKSAGVTATLGLACFPACSTEETLVKAADDALYEGKEKGRDRVVPAASSK